MTTPHMNHVRQMLLDTLADLRNKETPMEVDRARAVAQVASVIVDTAKAEIDYIRATGAGTSDFIEPEQINHSTHKPLEPTAHNPFPVSVSHRLRG